MSTDVRRSRWLERASDWANPILVKETRQALKSRQFVATFMLLLVISWFISTFGLLVAGSEIDYGTPGRTFFATFFMVLTFAILVIVPFGSYRSLLNERDESTFELLSITTLSPRQIVWGKLFSSLVQVFIFYSAIAPFIAFTSLLQGFDIAQAGFLLVLLMLVSLVFCMTALMLSTFGRQKHLQAMMSLVVLGGVVTGFFIFLSISSSMAFMGGLPLDDPDFWWGISAVLLAGGSYFVLFQQITTSRLTFESGNRSTGIRLICMAQFWLLWGGVFVTAYLYPTSFDEDILFFAASVSAIHWAIVGLFAATENNTLSHRVKRRLPRNRLLRLPLSLLLPGSSRGFLFVLLHVAALCLLTVGTKLFFQSGIWGSISSSTSSSYRSSSNDVVSFVSGLCCYILIYIGMASALTRWGRALSKEVKESHVRVLVLILFAFGSIFPMLPRALEYVPWPGYSLFDITNPFATLEELADMRSYSEVILYILAALALIFTAINLKAMRDGVREIVSSREHDDALTQAPLSVIVESPAT